jgi:DnaJ-class molecular chaperone
LIEKITHKLEDLTYKHLSPSEEIFGPRDLSFNLTIPAKDGPKGTEVRIAYNCNGKTERLRVRIPPINRSGVQLRLPEKGRQDANGCLGDLYLRVYLKYD